MKYIPNTLTFLRILGSVMLLFLEPLSTPFFTLYLVCGATDILDGYIARKTHNISKVGAALDSIADFIFLAVMLFLFIPIISLEAMACYWIIGIAVIRILSLFIGYAKYRTLASLHTYANKATGLSLFLFPFIFKFCGITIAEYIILIMASLSALEDIAINITSKALNINIKSIFHRNDTKSRRS
jgi:CDP-diacylglycerol--glycerol-3-phosphate 3-phosphatidyltransferase